MQNSTPAARPAGSGETTHRSRPWRTRFAPAPTGYLHLGHLVNAMYVWGLARAYGGEVLLRIEDHDRIRSRSHFETALLEDLDWLGFEPANGPVARLQGGPSSYRQSDNEARYSGYLAQLESAGLVYPCRCTRREIAERTGHREHEELWYPGTCRTAAVPPSETTARRVLFEPSAEAFVDARHGGVVQHPHLQCGDMLVRDRHAQWTYQFAVVVDDIEHDIDVVIRGDDLLESTGRQIQLARMLGRTSPPRFVHHPLIRHPDGAKLSKANNDTALRELRHRGASRAQLFGLAAHAAGMTGGNQPLELNDVTELVQCSLRVSGLFP